jgi:ATP-dependent DNA helicase DinG
VRKNSFSEKAREEITETIKESFENEVFFAGSLDENGVVDNIRVVACGNDYSVPAIVDSVKSG